MAEKEDLVYMTLQPCFLGYDTILWYALEPSVENILAYTAETGNHDNIPSSERKIKAQSGKTKT